MARWEDCDEVERDPERVSGAWVFRGTRVPVAALFENLRDGASIDDFLAWFPGVERQQVESVLNAEAVAIAAAAYGATVFVTRSSVRPIVIARPLARRS
jgi:uncharacterized protein (DUF433 family)